MREFKKLPKTVTAEMAAQRLSKKNIPVSEDDLEGMAADGLVPHIRWQDGSVVFEWDELEDWFVENWLNYYKGTRVPRILQVASLTSKAANSYDLPVGLKPMSRALYKIDDKCVLSGVYFLLDGDEVVYVGQSVNVVGRVYQHSEKKFDRAYYLYVVEDERIQVEDAFIRHFKPKYNGTKATEVRDCDRAILKSAGVSV
jgi:hypothetical protein